MQFTVPRSRYLSRNDRDEDEDEDVPGEAMSRLAGQHRAWMDHRESRRAGARDSLEDTAQTGRGKNAFEQSQQVFFFF
ncbi:hypothetical protein VTH06DRAFT_8601 [Thermothelomyces fergusii]